MDPAEQVPPVVAVVVTSDPGPWLEESLEALADQDYPNFSVLVVDAGSAIDPTSRVASVLPGAFVRRLPENNGFAAAANEALLVVEGASHLLLCHDDVAPDSDAVRVMVEEAFRSNAGVVAPKLVYWNDARRLLQVGMGIDKSGAPAPLVDRGDFDQGQHDGVRDVFFAPGGFTLVRADLFAALGGFDDGMFLYGEDLDLSWRAQLSGARVVVAPQARVRHLEAMSSGRRSIGHATAPSSPQQLSALVRPLQLRHRLRAVMSCYGTGHLVRVLPQVALLATAEVVFGLLSGHTRTARDTIGAWTWNLRRHRDLRAVRRHNRSVRRVSDVEVRRLQVSGSARFNGFVRGQLASQRNRRKGQGVRFRPRSTASSSSRGSVEPGGGLRLSMSVTIAVAVVLLVGSRHLLTGHIPAVHELARFPGGPMSFFRSMLSGWRETGLGDAGPAPPAMALLGLASVVMGGATALLRTVLVLGLLPLGAIGAFRLATPLGSRRARLAALVVYVAVPLPYNALANGRVGGLIAYGLAPWIVARLLRVGGVEPFFDDDGDGRLLATRDVMGLGLMLAVAAAFAPAMIVLVLLAALGLTAGAVLGGGWGAAGRGLLLALGSVVVAAVLLLPWSAGFVLPGSQLAGVTGGSVSPARALGLGALMRFETGPLGAPPLGWGLLIVATLALLVGRSWRLAWAVRMWALAVTCFGLTWAGGRGWLGVGIPAVELMLAPAAVALAVAVALGMVAVEVDLPGYRFGWRQLAPTAALTATLLGAIPVAAASLGGRWNLPRNDLGGLLSWMPAKQADGAFRVLWVGDPETLPLRGRELDEGVSFATSRGGPPDISYMWPGGSAGGTEVVADALRVARDTGTAHLGHLLAPTSIRYIVVPQQAAPGENRLDDRPPPPDVLRALDAQVDLRKLPGDPGVSVWENAAWLPGRARLAPDDAAASQASGFANSRAAELAGSEPVLADQRGRTRFAGPLAAGDSVFLAESSSSRWQLRVGGEAASRSTAFGFANSFDVTGAGPATLRYRTSPVHYALVLGQFLLWAGALRWWFVTRRRRGVDHR